jgi:hypothetical protein
MTHINHDYAKTKWPKKARINTPIAIAIAFLILLIGLAQLCATVVKAADSCVFETETDDLMSTDRAEFMLLHEHGQVMEEGDML